MNQARTLTTHQRVAASASSDTDDTDGDIIYEDTISECSTEGGDFQLDSEPEEAAVCRICLQCVPPEGFEDGGEELDRIGCDCRGALGLCHKKCAVTWFMPRARGRAEGLACELRWKLTWTVECEICGANVSADLQRRVIKECEDNLRRLREEHKQQRATQDASSIHADATDRTVVQLTRPEVVQRHHNTLYALRTLSYVLLIMIMVLVVILNLQITRQVTIVTVTPA